LSNLDTTTHENHTTSGHTGHAPARRVSSETKASFKTTELIAYVAAVIGVIVVSAVVDASDFGAQEAWSLITFLTIGYMISRGLAKSGSRDFYNDQSSDRNGR
jgi:hypothetical protein